MIRSEAMTGPTYEVYAMLVMQRYPAAASGLDGIAVRLDVEPSD